MPGKSLGDSSERTAIAATVFGAARELFLACGVTQAEISTAFERAMSGEQVDSESTANIYCQIAALLRHWHASERYTDDAGLPLALPKTGPLSIESLVADSGLSDETSLLRTAMNLGLIKKSVDHFVPTQREALVSGSGIPALWYASDTARRALQSMTHNLTARRTASRPIFHRAAHQHRLSAKRIPIFLKFFADHASEFIQMLDDWMDQNRAGATDPEAISVSVHSFAWIANKAQSKSTQQRSAKKRMKLRQC